MEKRPRAGGEKEGLGHDGKQKKGRFLEKGSKNTLERGLVRRQGGGTLWKEAGRSGMEISEFRPFQGTISRFAVAAAKKDKRGVQRLGEDGGYKGGKPGRDCFKGGCGEERGKRPKQKEKGGGLN